MMLGMVLARVLGMNLETTLDSIYFANATPSTKCEWAITPTKGKKPHI